eukprot:306566-Chlamydomonas_euryale.AAC.1
MGGGQGQGVRGALQTKELTIHLAAHDDERSVADSNEAAADAGAAAEAAAPARQQLDPRDRAAQRLCVSRWCSWRFPGVETAVERCVLLVHRQRGFAVGLRLVCCRFAVGCILFAAAGHQPNMDHAMHIRFTMPPRISPYSQFTYGVKMTGVAVKPGLLTRGYQHPPTPVKSPAIQSF